ncbi:polysaccharide deacetylase family protein [Pseudoalteromonas sp. MMG022]|uniref:polysaccharide deacetylase family protein n=1 Tax=Pseudoalteromonas sp. MMG022 TaxID=2909978 RepID=UPI001F314DB5|nr:polysaccharide deacetylase family protein [Pseudoalteromonas sp. MMG022]MCF6437518.1 polysaccharide deacetylase family protein [Pseudoalteromonas sp. MMG022]
MRAATQGVRLTVYLLASASFVSIADEDYSEQPFYPNGASNAVSITFDDGRHSQLDIGVPILNKHGIKATFYVSRDNVVARLPDWQKVVANGHEIGNHTTSHVCTGNFQWLRKQNKGLEQTSLDWLRKDIEQTNIYIEKHLKVKPRSFAYPCGNTFVGRGQNVKSYVPMVATLFESGRTWLDETANDPTYTDFAQLTGIRIDGMSFDEIKQLLDLLRFRNSWVILAGHDVGKKGPYTVDSVALAQLIIYLKQPKNGYWLDTVDNITKHIKKNRAPIK